jgi:hypothetical protein
MDEKGPYNMTLKLTPGWPHGKVMYGFGIGSEPAAAAAQLSLSLAGTCGSHPFDVLFQDCEIYGCCRQRKFRSVRQAFSQDIDAAFNTDLRHCMMFILVAQ